MSDFETKLFWSNAKFVFVTTLPVFWLMLARVFSKNRQQISGKRLALLFIVPAITVLLISVNRWHFLVFREMALEDMGFFTTISRSYGTWFWIHTTYSYALVVSGVVLFLRCIFRNRGPLRVQATIMAIGSVFPFVFNAFYLSNPDAFYHLDFTPVVFAITGVVYWVGLFRYRLLDLIPIAQQEVLKTIGDAVFVVDSDDLIVDVNEAGI